MVLKESLRWRTGNGAYVVGWLRNTLNDGNEVGEGSVGSVAYEGEGQNGTFTTEPLRHETCDALVAVPA